MRRSGRLRKVKRVDYNVDRAFKRMVEQRSGMTEEEVFGDPKAQKITRRQANGKRRPPRVPRPAGNARARTGPAARERQRRAPVDPGEADWERTRKAIWAKVLGLDSPAVRVEKIVGRRGLPDGEAPTIEIGREPMSGKRKHLLFINPGDKPLRLAIEALYYGKPMPAWTRNFRDQLSLKDGVLLWNEEGQAAPLPLWTAAEKRDNVKLLYYDPSKASTILPITLSLRDKAANVSRSNVTHILRSLKQYQLTFRRRLPTNIAEKTLYRSPGIIAADTFYPSDKEPYGWHGKFAVLAIMDVWSRFSRAYVCEDKRAETVGKGIKKFLTEFASLSPVPPRRFICDTGSELAAGLLEEEVGLLEDGGGHNGVAAPIEESLEPVADDGEPPPGGWGIVLDGLQRASPHGMHCCRRQRPAAYHSTATAQRRASGPAALLSPRV